MKKNFTPLFLLFPFFLFAQGEGNIWYFGHNAGINFNSGSAVSIPGPIFTLEGCASICNSSGSLLFSTDGITVYNANNVSMGTGLWGNPSSTQSGVIIPKPGNPTQYYIFTEAAMAAANGFAYSVVDMTLNSGLGGIISQNTQLLTPTCEKITAVRHSNGVDIWVIVHIYPGNSFYAYQITPTGILAPVITAIGTGINGTSNTIGYLKASPNGQKLAAARWGVANEPVEVFDFNSGTGVLSNYVSIPSAGGSYGISFSPDNLKLYVAFNNMSSVNLEQFDLTMPNWQNTPFILLQGTGLSYGALQLAPDGKIYFVSYGATSLGVINNPNSVGAACNFNQFGFSLLTGNCAYGLPNFLDYFVTQQQCSLNLGPDTIVCSNFTYTLDAGSGAASYLWQDLSTNQTLTVTSAGQYYCTKTCVSGSIISDTVNILYSPNPAPVFSLGNDSSICNGNTLTLTAPSGNYSYLWQNGDTTQTITAGSSGNFSVIVTDNTGCSTDDSLQLTIVTPLLNLGNDTTICTGTSVVLNAGNNFATYNWSTSQTVQTITVSNAGNYFVDVIDSLGCMANDTILIAVSTPVIDLGNDTIICFPSNLILNAGVGFTSYLWENNAVGQTHTASVTGTYYVTATNSFTCIAIDSIYILKSHPIVNLGNDTTICIGQSININAGNNFSNYAWSTSQNSQTIIVSSTGNYSVVVTDSVGCTATDSKTLAVSSPSIFIGNDTLVCNQVMLTLNAGGGFNSYQWENSSPNQFHSVNQPGVYYVTVSNNFNCVTSDTINLSLSAPSVDLGNDTVICTNSTITLDAGNFNIYSWSDGSMSKTLTVNNAGIYSVIVTDLFGCVAADTVQILPINCFNFYIPTAFSPNGDGSNDVFHILNAENIHLGVLQVYNRWGQLLFETKDATQGWDGTFHAENCEIGSYIFVLTGTTIIGENIFEKGNVTLIR